MVTTIINYNAILFWHTAQNIPSIHTEV
jgi:hypothetical protein